MKMANGDIPVSGSAPSNPDDPDAEFTLRFINGGSPDGREDMLVRTHGRQLHIEVNNGKGKIFDEDLHSPGWTLRITAR
jgi:hypothetical protein